EHLEHVTTATDALTAVEERPAARREQDDRDRHGDGQGGEEEERREDDVERAQRRVTRPGLAAFGELREPNDEGVTRLRRGQVRIVEPAPPGPGLHNECLWTRVS